MSSSRNKNFRRRNEEEDSVDDKHKSKSSVLSSSTPKSLKNQTRTKPRPPKLLSFADDDDEDDNPAPIRTNRRTSSSSSLKPASVHKHTFASGPSLLPIPTNVQPQTGEYTTEKLRELRKNTRPLGGVTKSSSQLGSLSTSGMNPPKIKKTEASAGASFILKGLVKPVTVQETPTGVVESDEDEEDVNGYMFSKLGIKIKGKDSSGIPDQAYINAIKAKKEQKRQLGAALPDYISLDGGGVTSTRISGGSSDDEDNDFRGRMSLFPDTKDAESKKGIFEALTETRVVDGGLEKMDNDDEDDEERIWEEEQFRKGLGKRLDDPTSSHGVTNAVTAIPPTIETQAFAYPHQDMFSSGSLETGFGVSRSAEALTISQQAEIASKAFRENINRLKDSHKETLSSLVKVEDNLFESLSNITHLEKSLEDAGKKFVYMQELRNFISVMCDFLQDKAPFIEELEEHMQRLHEDRISGILERRAANLSDETDEVDASVNAAMSVLSKGSGSSYVSAATTAAHAAFAASKESSNIPVQLDEFGRDLNLQKRMDLARRADMRKNRKERSEAKRIAMGGNNACCLVEGECSTDESDSESKAYQSNQDELLQTSEQIFSDAADDYSNLSVVKEKFEEWKKLHPSAYRDSYMTLSAPDIFSPYVRLELLKWDPLYEDIDFNDMKWHTELFDYGMGDNDKNFDSDDADSNLIPELIEKIALPILHHEIAHCWDVLSTKKTRNAVSATKMIVNYVQPFSAGLRDLLVVVRNRLIESVKNLKVPTWSPTVMKIVPDSAQVAAFRFGVSVRQLRNICLWKNILSFPVLEEIAIDMLLIEKVLPHLYSVMPNIHDAVTRTERVVASLSGVWSGPKVEDRRKLPPLVNYVTELTRKLEKRHALGAISDTTGLVRRLKKMMVDLNEYDKARAILRTFQIKEAL